MVPLQSSSLKALVMLLGDVITQKSVFEETVLEISTVKVSMVAGSQGLQQGYQLGSSLIGVCW